MLDIPLAAQISGFCRKIHEAGFPVMRCQIGMDTLHPRYGSHTFVWRPDADAAEHRPHERAVTSHDFYLKSPVHYMRSRGIVALRRRLDSTDSDEFLLFAELRAQGLTEYAARIVPYDPADLEAIAKLVDNSGQPPQSGKPLEGIFFSCATDRPGGFDDGQLDQVSRTLPYLALALKSRLNTTSQARS